MQTTIPTTAVSTLALTSAAYADAPPVAFDIAPVHSLVAKVVGSVVTPGLIVRQSASSHGSSFRPAEREALQEVACVWPA